MPDAVICPSDLYDEAQAAVAAHWRRRIVERIAEQINRDLREGLPSLPTNEEAAMAMIRSVAGELEAAAKALDLAARTLKDSGKGPAATQAHLAAQRAAKAATGLVGG